MGTALFHLAEVAYAKTDLAAARSRFEESLVLSREVGNKAYTAWAYAELAWVALYQGEYARVDPLVEEGLVFFRELGIQTGNGITRTRAWP